MLWQKALQLLFHLCGGVNPAAFGVTARCRTLPARGITESLRLEKRDREGAKCSRCRVETTVLLLV